MGGGTGRRDRGSTERSRGHTQCARGQQRARQEGHPKTKGQQNIKEGQIEGAGPRGRRGKQGANEGAKVHFVFPRETPCR